jgi:hypothetical protein
VSIIFKYWSLIHKGCSTSWYITFLRCSFQISYEVVLCTIFAIWYLRMDLVTVHQVLDRLLLRYEVSAKDFLLRWCLKKSDTNTYVILHNII